MKQGSLFSLFSLLRHSLQLLQRSAVATIVIACAVNTYAQEEDAGNDSATHTNVQRVQSADSAANRQQLVRNLRELISRTESGRGRVSAAVYSLDKNSLLFDYRSGEALTPASTTKLFFTYAAMKLLGADYGVPTTVVTDGTLRSDSVLVGNVYLVGHGDCLLTPNDIELLAEQLRRSGIRSIQGDVVGDASFFDAVSERQAYSGDAERMQDMPPISALGINKNLVTVLVSSNGSGGTHVQTVPQSSALRVMSGNTYGGNGSGNVGGNVSGTTGGNNSDAVKIQARSQSQAQLQSLMQATPKPAARTQQIQHEAPRVAKHEARRAAASVRAKRSKVKTQRRVSAKKHRRQTRTTHSKKHRRRATLAPEFLRFERIPQFPAYGSDEAFGDMRLPLPRTKRSRATRRARVSVSSSMSANGVQVFSVRGSVPRNTTRAFTYEIGRPALATAGVLVRSLQAEGIRVAGNVREGRAPASARTLAEVRRPLTELLHPVNKNSDNFVAEHVMKIVGAHCCGNVMCSVNAFKTVTSILDSASIPHSGCVLYDGSGLSRRNKTSASTQMYMLKSIAEQPFAGTFMNTMAIAGVDGTIRRRMLGTNAVGNVHAKTGTHSSVSALSGYVRSKDGERFCFSIIGNALPAGVLKQMENACVIQLAEFSHREGTVSLAKPRRR